MFDGVQDQFHQFLASSRANSNTSLPIPLSFSLYGSNSPTYSTAFDPFSQPPPQSHHFVQPLHHHHKEQLPAESTDPWRNEEVLALLKIRSNAETWFPDFTWEHVSRKLSEIGFKRSAEKCKEKFEEESRYLNSINCSSSSSKNYRLFGELEALYHGSEHHHHHQFHDQALSDQEKNQNAAAEEEEEEEDKRDQLMLEDDTRTTEGQSVDSEDKVEDKNKRSMKKRKRQKKYEMFKGFCESIVSKMMTHQEELLNKVLEDMIKRDEEKIAREEAWKRQEMERIAKEMEFRANEQAIASDRQAKIIEFLKKFNHGEDMTENCNLYKVPNTTPSSSILSINTSTPTSSNVSQVHQDENQASQNPSSPKKPPDQVNKQTSMEKEDTGKRWPRDEVLALINIRCSLFKTNGDDREANCNSKGPLWERISKSMAELGYRRSAKRCKEKWENINKYFRKTKDMSKKRSVNSRTCPYFHQLSYLYSQGTINVGPFDRPENRSGDGAGTAMHTPEAEDQVNLSKYDQLPAIL